MNAIEVMAIEPADIFKNNWTARADEVFLTESGTSNVFTFKEVLTMSQNLADELKKQGFQENSKLAISLNNSVDFAVLYFACILGKIITVPLNPMLGDAQKQFIIEECGPNGIVCSEDQVAKMQKWNGNAIPIYLLAGNRFQSASDASKFMESRKMATNMVNIDAISADQILTIVYTSGTTANPKGVVHTVGNLFRNAYAFNTFMGIKSGHRFYNHLPMTYLGGYYNLLILPFCSGCSTVIAKPFGPEAILNFWDPIIESGATVLWLVPTILHILNAYDRGTKGIAYCKEKVELILCGTAPLHAEVRNKFTEKYGLKIYENYGLSETLFLSAQSPTLGDNLNNVGQRLNWADISISSAVGLEVTGREEGNILTKTPTLMLGYFADWKEGKTMLNSDWFDTGDFGKLENNILSITGRIKDIIIRGGINISPVQIEDVVLKSNGVKECAVIGVTDLLNGEKVIAYVTLADENMEETVLAEIYNNCKQNLSPIQQPDEVLIIAEMPKSSTGKIRKTDLRQNYGSLRAK